MPRGSNGGAYGYARGKTMRAVMHEWRGARRRVLGAAGCVALLAAGGCVMHESKPLPRLNPTQAERKRAPDELLDVAVHPFDPGIPPNLDAKALDKQRINPDIRRAESRYLANLLRATLESSGQWGAVRVTPESAQFVDVLVQGRILESTGAKLALEVRVSDSTGRVWISARRYESPPDTGSYKTDAALKARDPFQNVYSQIANDMVAARDALQVTEQRDIRRVTQLRFANDLAPAAINGYLVSDARGFMKVARLPATNDPIATRVEGIRQRDAGVIDTVNGYYANFSEQMSASYGQCRCASFEEVEQEQRAHNHARTSTYLGAAAVLASVFVPNQCNPYDYNCRRVQSAARYGGAVGGAAAILSGLKKYADAK